MSATEPPIGANPKSSVPVCVAVCSLLIILALVLGVGLASNLVLRHIVQTVPFCVAAVLGVRRLLSAQLHPLNCASLRGKAGWPV